MLALALFPEQYVSARAFRSGPFRRERFGAGQVRLGLGLKLRLGLG